MDKYNTGKGSIYNTKEGNLSTNFFMGVVISNTDKSDGGRIKVRIKSIDDTLSDEELPYAYPLLQKFINITPKVSEVVFVMVPNANNPYLDRVFIGPIISQPQMLEKDNLVSGAASMLDTGLISGGVAPSTIPENRGSYPEKEDIAIQGRQNSDLIFKRNEVILRAGKFTLDSPRGTIPKFNIKNPSYIQIKHSKSNNNNGFINVVANKIHLLTHEEGSPRFILNDQESQITDGELKKIMENAHPLVFGDLLLEYLELMRNALISHVHPYNGMTPQDLAGTNAIKKFLEFDINKILSKNIKIN